jgi:hypothetical protein
MNRAEANLLALTLPPPSAFWPSGILRVGTDSNKANGDIFFALLRETCRNGNWIG